MEEFIFSLSTAPLDMYIKAESGKVEDKKTELLSLGIFEDEKLSGDPNIVDEAVGGEISRLIRQGDFSGKPNQYAVIYTKKKIAPKRLLLVGLGKKKEFELDTARNAAGKAALQVRELGSQSFATHLFGEEVGLRLGDLTRAFVEGADLALYRFTKYKTDIEKIPKEVNELSIVIRDKKKLEEVQRACKIASSVCEATKFAREIQNLPGNEVTPKRLGEIAHEVAKEGGFTCRVLGRNEIRKLGMGGLWSVSKGSSEEPMLIVMEYDGAGNGKRPIALVGKAVTFDSGGISIKPAEKMEDMKFDKSGGVTVIATLKAVAALKLPLNVTGIVPATENLPGGSSFKPGDIIKFYNGKTAEVVNTDAEGRIILADALSYSSSLNPEFVIDLATLTGACVIALGGIASGLFTNDDELANMLLKAGEVSGDRVWRLPLWKDYHDQIKSDYADIKNVGGRPGGAITAAAFLSNFVGAHRWAHLDIAGTAWTQEGSPSRTYLTKGGTGVGVRLLTRLLMDLSTQEQKGKERKGKERKGKEMAKGKVRRK